MLGKPRQSSYLNNSLPYHSQWESKELVDEILHGTIHAKEDPLWKNSQASSKEEYEHFSWNICGMACLKMILTSKFSKNYATVTLAKKCSEYGGYKNNPDGSMDGLFYEPFLKFITNEFGLRGKIIKPMIIGDILNALQKEEYVIVSVNPNIRNPSINPKTKGGHLVLVSGYNFDKQLLYIHNPSGFYNKSQKHFPISFTDFEKFFAHRGVLVH